MLREFVRKLFRMAHRGLGIEVLEIGDEPVRAAELCHVAEISAAVHKPSVEDGAVRLRHELRIARHELLLARSRAQVHHSPSHAQSVDESVVRGGDADKVGASRRRETARAGHERDLVGKGRREQFERGKDEFAHALALFRSIDDECRPPDFLLPFYGEHGVKDARRRPALLVAPQLGSRDRTGNELTFRDGGKALGLFLFHGRAAAHLRLYDLARDVVVRAENGGRKIIHRVIVLIHVIDQHRVVELLGAAQHDMVGKRRAHARAHEHPGRSLLCGGRIGEGHGGRIRDNCGAAHHHSPLRIQAVQLRECPLHAHGGVDRTELGEVDVFGDVVDGVPHAGRRARIGGVVDIRLDTFDEFRHDYLLMSPS